MSKLSAVLSPEDQAKRMAEIAAILPEITEADLLPEERNAQHEIAMMRDAAANLTNLADARSKNIMQAAIIRKLAERQIEAKTGDA